jgi:plastocyanin
VSRRAGLTVAFLLVLALALVPAADASNRRIAISNYQWSDPDVEINQGEHVTWYWTGPDTMHSITGNSANDLEIDTDPGTNRPDHQIGDQFQLSFDQPGTYSFHCKLHSTVKGVITVDPVPGDPVTEPDPVPKSNVDLSPPPVRDLRLAAHRVGRRGTSLSFSLGEDAKLAADYYRYDSKGRRHYAGYATWPGHIGLNGVRFAARRHHFRPRPGKYLAIIRATDDASNVSKPHRLGFHIRPR